jgi:hypothetical protein
MQNFPVPAVAPCIGTQDTNHVFEDWHTEYLGCDNEHTVHRMLFQIGILLVLKYIKMRTGLSSKTKTLKNHIKFKTQSEKFKGSFCS